MAATPRAPISYTTQYPEHGGLLIPHVVVPQDHARFDADFLRAVYDCSRDANGERLVVTRTELEYIRAKMCLVCMPRIACFGDVVQPIEYPELIVIPPTALDTACGKEIIVFMCHFVLQSGDIDCHYLGFCFRNNIGVCTRSPVGDDLLIAAGTLVPVHTLIGALRTRNASATQPAPPDTTACAASTSVPEPPSLCASIDMVVSGGGSADGTVHEPGPFIFCCFDKFPELGGCPAFVEQICARAVGRRWCYNAISAGTPCAHVTQRLDTLFNGGTANDLAHELVVVFVLAIIFKDRTEFFIESELAIMEYRIAHKLTDYTTRLRFLEMNGLEQKYAKHQPVCTHEHLTCLTSFVLDEYRSTLERLVRIASYIMYDMPQDQALPSVVAYTDTLTEIIEGVARVTQQRQR